METLGSIAHWLAVSFFWIFLLAAIILLAVSIIYYIAAFLNKIREGVTIGSIFLGGFLVTGLIAYALSGEAGYKEGIKHKVNRVVHFSSKEVKLEKKVSELSDLRQQLIQKQQEVRKLQTEYQNDIRSLINEIKSEQKSNKIQTFYQAQQHPRISYDLSLIQRKKAYIAKLQETEIKLQHGTYELEFLERQAIDDLKIVKTLGSDRVEKLVTEINTIISKYLPEAGELAIEVDPKSMQTPEQIWNQINSGN
ncbi:MAG: hypothetical protein NTX82_07230 [Candidatus Parcubacteria bacterium]|nr:hypothetical protein [Candidatus Parcubacteria bacterium]